MERVSNINAIYYIAAWWWLDPFTPAFVPGWQVFNQHGYDWSYKSKGPSQGAPKEKLSLTQGHSPQALPVQASPCTDVCTAVKTSVNIF